MLRAVLFDFGGVFTLSPFPVIADAAPEFGMTPQAALEMCFGVYDVDGDHPWHRLERGEISLEQARGELAALAREQEIEVDFLALFGRMGHEDPDRPAMVEGARQIRRRGLRTALVTNNVREFGDGWRKMVPVDELFEVIIDSSAVGIRKPDPRIFQLALDALGVAGHEAAFVDDHPGNIRAAESLGMTGILVGPDRPQALTALDAALAESAA
ncbi:MAG TPA: HAD family phosphatase [Frankiaceae bacterium]|nr:HAD family phosphatase [Frankiaceae bacterium]